MVNLATFTIVAHRNLISLYDLREESNDWIDTKRVSDDYIRDISIEKRRHVDRHNKNSSGLETSATQNLSISTMKTKVGSKKKPQLLVDLTTKYEIGCLSGSAKIIYVQVRPRESRSGNNDK